MNRLIWIFFFLASVLFCSCEKDQGHHSRGEMMTDSIEAIIAPLYQSGDFTGNVLVADAEGVLYKKAFGMADRVTSRPLTVQTPFYLASVSKQFTAAAILLLYQDSLLSLEDPIKNYLPELPSSIYDKVTVRHLLHHTSGIPDYYEFAIPTPGFTNADVFELLQEVDSLRFEPGEKYAYSNSGYVLLSLIVEKVSGKTFAAFVKSNILEPVQMRDCTVRDEYADEIKNPAIGYDSDGSISDYEYCTTGGGGFYASVEDLYKWDRALYKGNIIDTVLLKEEAWISGVLNDGSETHYGFGWDLDPKRPWIVRHGGDLDGFRTHFFRDTKNHIAVIILSNSGYEDVGGLCDEIYDMVIK